MNEIICEGCGMPESRCKHLDGCQTRRRGMSEPKNPYPDKTFENPNFEVPKSAHEIWQEGYDACKSYYSKLAEGGRESLISELMKIADNWDRYNNECLNKGEEVLTYEKAADSLLPILRAMVKQAVDSELAIQADAYEFRLNTQRAELDVKLKEQVEAEIKRRGLVKLAEDQTLPEGVGECMDCIDSKRMIDAGFRRIEQPKEGEG